MDDRSSDYKWNGSAIKLLLALYKDRKPDFRDPKKKNINVWREIVQEMKKEGVNCLDVDRADRKFRNLKHTYIKIKLKKESTGQGPIKWKYFDEMEDIFADDSPIVECNTISSFNEEHSEDSMICDNYSPNYSSSDDDGSSSFLKSPNTGEAPYFCDTVFKKRKAKKTNVRKLLISQTNKIIKIEEERNEHLSRIANVMDESNRLFQKYINILESKSKQK